MRKIGIVLFVTGLALVGWFGFQYWNGMQAVTKLDDDVVKQENVEGTMSLTNDTDEKSNSDVNDVDGAETSTEEQDNKPTNKTEKPSFDHQDGDEVAQLVMPSIDLSFGVFMGTSDDVLAQGVGMYDSEWTTAPDQGGHTVLSGHRDSVFQPVGELVEGDSLFVNYQGEDYQYEINKIWITDEDDHSVIVEKDDPTLTLSTCYPFHFIGSAPDRYIVQAELIQKGDFLNLD